MRRVKFDWTQADTLLIEEKKSRIVLNEFTKASVSFLLLLLALAVIIEVFPHCCQVKRAYQVNLAQGFFSVYYPNNDQSQSHVLIGMIESTCKYTHSSFVAIDSHTRHF